MAERFDYKHFWYDLFPQIDERLVDVITILDLNLNFLFLTRGVERLLGYRPDELIGKNVLEIFSENTAKEVMEIFARELEKEKDPNMDPNRTLVLLLKEVTKDGRIIPVEATLSGIRDEEGRLKYILSVSRDVSERLKLQRTIEESEEKLRIIFNSTKDAIFIHDADTGQIIDVNDSMLKMYGYESKQEVIGKDVSYFSGEGYYREMALDFIKKSLDSPQVFEWKARGKKGNEFWVEVSLTSTSFREIDIVVAVVRDISQRKMLEKRLREQVDLFGTLADVTSTGIGIFNEQGYVYVNKASESITGYSKEEFIGQPFYFMVHPDHRDLVIHRGLSRLKGEKDFPVRYEIKILTKKGEEKWVDFTAGRILYRGRPAIVWTVYDITHIKEAQQLLVREKEKLSAILESVEDAIITTDIKGCITYINSSGEKIFELLKNVVIGKTIDSVFEFINSTTNEIAENPVNRCLKQGNSIEGYEITVVAIESKKAVDAEYKISPIKDEKGVIVGSVLVIRDVTERRVFFEAAQNAQKLEALGTLAAGIAHDFNNLLTGVYGFIDLAVVKAKDSSISEYLKKSIKSLDRARHLTNQLLTFARGGDPVKKVDYLSQLVRESVEFALSGSRIKVSFDLDDTVMASFDKNQLAQVIDNIVINAVESMPDRGEIKVELKKVNISETYRCSLPKGEYAEIKISDTGCGIPPNILGHIFDPFYTTKGQGHGLGLAISYSIVKKHGGNILVESEPGVGSTFYIYLPSVRIGHKKDTGKDKLTCVEELSCDGTIVVMDDEEFMLELLLDALKYLGFEVVLRKNGEELIDFIKGLNEEQKADIKAIFLDMTIVGGMGGLDAANRIRGLIDAPFVVMSGYSSDPVMSNPKEYGFETSLKKPFTIEELTEVIKGFVIKEV